MQGGEWEGERSEMQGGEWEGGDGRRGVRWGERMWEEKAWDVERRVGGRVKKTFYQSEYIRC